MLLDRDDSVLLVVDAQPGFLGLGSEPLAEDVAHVLFQVSRSRARVGCAIPCTLGKPC